MKIFILIREQFPTTYIFFESLVLKTQFHITFSNKIHKIYFTVHKIQIAQNDQ